MNGLADHIVVVFPLPKQFQIFCELMGRTHHWHSERHRTYVRREIDDLKAHSLALRCGARIAPANRIVSWHST